MTLPEWLDAAVWEQFRLHRKKIKAPMTEYAETLIIRKLTALHKQGYEVTDILNESIERGWRGIFEAGHVPKVAPKPLIQRVHLSADDRAEYEKHFPGWKQ